MSQNPTLSAAAKTLSKATGAKHTACLRALEHAAAATTDPEMRLELAGRILVVGPSHDSTGDAPQPAPKHFDVEAWWASGRHLGIYGYTGTGKTVLAQYLAGFALTRGVQSWALDLSGNVGGWAGLVGNAAELDGNFMWARSVLRSASEGAEDRVLFIENLSAITAYGDRLSYLDAIHTSGRHQEAQAAAQALSLGQQLHELLIHSPQGLRIVATNQATTFALGAPLTTLIGTGDAIRLGGSRPRELISVGMDPDTVEPTQVHGGIHRGPAGQTYFAPVDPVSPYRAGELWNEFYKREGVRAQQAPLRTPFRSTPDFQVGDQLRFYCEKRRVWKVRAVVEKQGEGWEQQSPVVVATARVFGQDRYLALDLDRGVRGPHDSWGHAAVTDEDCARTSAALAAGEIDFSARNSVRLDLRSVERDGEIIWSDED